MIAFFASPLGRWLVMLAMVAAACAFSFVKGIGYESDRRDAADARAFKAGMGLHLKAVATGQAAAKEAIAADATAGDYYHQLRSKQREAKPSTLAVVKPNPATPQPAGECAPSQIIGIPVPSNPNRGDVLFTSEFIGLWDGAWTDAGGKPVFGNPGGAAPEVQPADTAGPTVDPKQVLDNHADNAEACSADRRRLDRLVDLLNKLEAQWGAAHRR